MKELRTSLNLILTTLHKARLQAVCKQAPLTLANEEKLA